MEVTPVGLLLNTVSESYDFEDELDATGNAKTDSIDGEVEEPHSDDKKNKWRVKKRHMTKEVVRTQRFAQQRNMCGAAKFDQKKLTRHRDYRADLESQSLTYNQSIVQTFGGRYFSANETVVIKRHITTTLRDLLRANLGERMVTWHIEAPMNAAYQVVPRAFALSDCLFNEVQKLKSYRVLYRGKYYLFEFEGGELKEYCRVKHDRT